MQEILYQIYNGVNTESKESKVDIRSRVPFLEATISPYPFGVDVVESRHPPRLMKSHLHADFFEKQLREGQGKFIVVMRNVKDTLVSFYNFYKRILPHDYAPRMTWQRFFEKFQERQLLHGDWLDFNLSWWKLRERTDNILIVKYEDMKNDLRGIILKVADFVGKTLSEEQVSKLVEHASFSSMKNNEAVNHTMRVGPNYKADAPPFMRKGLVGGWKSELTPEEDQYLEEKYVKMAEKHGLVFEYSE